MEANIYNTKGKEVGKVSLPEAIFGVELNNDLVADVASSMTANKRVNLAHTKDRSEVSGGGKKPWKQKGTGRARHGSSRSPIWVGGGITFGPRNEKDYSKKINKKVKTKAFNMVLSAKLAEGEIIFVDSLDLNNPSSKNAREAMKGLSSIKGFEDILSKRKNSAVISTPQKDENTIKSFGNFGNFATSIAKDLNVLDLLKYKYLVVVNPQESIKGLER